jgi:hypothetical protein
MQAASERPQLGGVISRTVVLSRRSDFADRRTAVSCLQPPQWEHPTVAITPQNAVRSPAHASKPGSVSVPRHWLEQERPEQVTKLLVQFLQDASAPDRKL